MNKITPNLWFDNQAEEAAEFYVSIFPNSRIKGIIPYGGSASKIAGKTKGTVMTVSFSLDGEDFVALNGGPQFKFSEAISFIVNCENQKEIDYFWDKLTADGGKESQCGWLKDKFGVSWQVIPDDWDETFSKADPKKAEKMMAALLKMKKINIKELEEAYEGK